MARWLVKPNVIGKWDIRLDGAGQYTDRKSTRAAAEEAARQLAGQAGGEIVVLDDHDRVLDSYTVPPPAATRPSQSSAKVTPPATPASVSSPAPAPQQERDRGKEISDALGVVGKVVDGATGVASDKTSPSEALSKELIGKADHVLDARFQSWWKRADGYQRGAAWVLILVVLVGPIGATWLSVVQAAAHPRVSVQIWEALGWLAFLTLPVFLASAAVVLSMGRVANPYAFVLIVAAASVGGAFIVGMFGAPTSLGDLYCYASTHGLVYQSQCRYMDTHGYVQSAIQGGTSKSQLLRDISGAYTVVREARGDLMTFCGITAGVAVGFLLRRENI
jgi:hypothetical protein